MLKLYRVEYTLRGQFHSKLMGEGEKIVALETLSKLYPTLKVNVEEVPK